MFKMGKSTKSPLGPTIVAMVPLLTLPIIVDNYSPTNTSKMLHSEALFGSISFGNFCFFRPKTSGK